MSPLEVVGLAAGASAVASGAVTLIGFSLRRKQVAIEKGRGQGMRDAEVSQLRATVDHHNDKIGELDDWKQETSKTLTKLSTDNDWIKAALGGLKEGVDELRRRA